MSATLSYHLSDPYDLLQNLAPAYDGFVSLLPSPEDYFVAGTHSTNIGIESEE